MRISSAGFDVLVVVIVGVETGTASLAGDRAAHQAAAGRAKVEARAAQVGVVQVGTGPVDLGQPRAAQVGADEVGFLHPRAGQKRTAKVGVVEVGNRQHHLFQVTVAEVGAAKAGTVEPGKP